MVREVTYGAGDDEGETPVSPNVDADIGVERATFVSSFTQTEAEVEMREMRNYTLAVTRCGERIHCRQTMTGSCNASSSRKVEFCERCLSNVVLCKRYR